MADIHKIGSLLPPAKTDDICGRLKSRAKASPPADRELMLEAAKKIVWMRREVKRLKNLPTSQGEDEDDFVG